MAKLYPDSKTFVDMKLKVSPEKTMEDFEAFMSSKNNKPSKDEIQEFVDVRKNFIVWLTNYYKFY